MQIYILASAALVWAVPMKGNIEMFIQAVST